MEIRQAQHDTIPASRNKGQGQAHHDTITASRQSFM
jgi:hypothetical protein